ncbi:MAG: hypothetical protein F6K00_22100 [Leptolyngbya sp. SIOISBB]|nr:hypothetical protein [Leptolyngbya sp. SIOISBB]
MPQYDLTSPERIIPLREQRQGDSLYGLDIRISEPDRVASWVQAISICLDNFRLDDRLTIDQVNIRLTCTLAKISIQIETASGEDLLSLLPVIDTILPARQLFQARAELYAQREGEFSPIEEENLELLRNQLQLAPDTAGHIKNRALGPYQDRQTKLNRYRELLNAELNRQFPLSNNTEAELERFCQVIGLSADDDVAAIRTEAIAQCQPSEEQSEISALDEAQVIETSTVEELSLQQQRAIQQQQVEQYRQEFASAITRSPYPSEFDRGRLEQARRTWQLDREIVRAIEREVTDERYGPIDSALGLDYTRLRQLLWLNHLEAADQETERLILSALSQDMRPLTADTLLRLSQYCVDVQTIDHLWSHYSKGKFGFAAQQKIYLTQDRQPGDFLTAVEWAENVGIGSVNLLVRHKTYRSLQFHQQAPTGHLPTWRWIADSLEGNYIISDDIVQMMFHDLIEKCLPQLKKTSNAPSPETGNQQS